MPLISVVIPVYNEEHCLNQLFERLIKLEAGEDTYEFIFVDDGSTDTSREIIRDLAEKHKQVKYLFFSRNFGHEAATTAGLDNTTGDAVVIIDADLQDPPELIPAMIEKWREGNKIVYAQRRTRKGESIHKKFSSWLFYRTIRKLCDVDIPIDTGDFRLMDKRVVEEFRRCREQNRFVRGLVAWTGFRQIAVPYDRDERYAGETKYNWAKLFMLALDATLGFSNLPLRIGILAGFLVCTISFIMIGVIVIKKIFYDIAVPGYALMVTGMFFLGGVQLFIMGLIGEYIGRIYRQAQERPLYIIAHKSSSLSLSTENQISRCRSAEHDDPRCPQDSSV